MAGTADQGVLTLEGIDRELTTSLIVQGWEVVKGALDHKPGARHRSKRARCRCPGFPEKARSPRRVHGEPPKSASGLATPMRGLMTFSPKNCPNVQPARTLFAFAGPTKTSTVQEAGWLPVPKFPK